MSTQLDILALEPYYGGARRAMLETLIRCSRHRWTVLKLPPRRMERRLAAAAHWFGEQLSLHWVGRVDLLLVSDAINLGDLYRLVPALSGKPSVAYFHTNFMPAAGTIDESDPDMAAAAAAVIANLSTAAAANELWFNSIFHHKSFLQRATTFLQRHSQTFARSPLNDLAKKTRVMVPPTDLHLAEHAHQAQPTGHDQKTFFIDTREADCQLISDGLLELQLSTDDFKLLAVGPTGGFSKRLTVEPVADDESSVMRAMLRSAVAISGRREPTWDLAMLTALAAGCWPVAPAGGVYTELIPKPLSERCLFEGTPEGLAATIQDFWELQLPDGHAEQIRNSLKRFNPITASKAMDERFSELAAIGVSHGPRTSVELPGR
ncbi:MAG TPA: DUF3524 domain-containing protein [Tepidisphaeraceae bacterium]|nr:DUF3524 domain-containing protein [Tepidisphaeraceae bacterium]